MFFSLTVVISSLQQLSLSPFFLLSDVTGVHWVMADLFMETDHTGNTDVAMVTACLRDPSGFRNTAYILHPMKRSLGRNRGAKALLQFFFSSLKQVPIVVLTISSPDVIRRDLLRSTSLDRLTVHYTLKQCVFFFLSRSACCICVSPALVTLISFSGSCSCLSRDPVSSAHLPGLSMTQAKAHFVPQSHLVIFCAPPSSRPRCNPRWKGGTKTYILKGVQSH